MKYENTLFLIPARGGSKGIPGKNIKLLGGKPLINYTIEAARELVSDEQICVSTDDAAIIETVKKTGLEVPFVRPADLADDHAGMQGVMVHALDFYAEKKGRDYDKIVLLQPTSPFRIARHISEAFDLYDESLDMVVSVKEADSNPYYVHFQENKHGFLEKLLDGHFTTRQSVPTVYEYNGAVYVINADAIRRCSRSHFTKVKKYVMSSRDSLDLDTPLDWAFCEFLMKH